MKKNRHRFLCLFLALILAVSVSAECAAAVLSVSASSADTDSSDDSIISANSASTVPDTDDTSDDPETTDDDDASADSSASDDDSSAEDDTSGSNETSADTGNDSSGDSSAGSDASNSDGTSADRVSADDAAANPSASDNDSSAADDPSGNTETAGSDIASDEGAADNTASNDSPAGSSDSGGYGASADSASADDTSDDEKSVGSDDSSTGGDDNSSAADDVSDSGETAGSEAASADSSADCDVSNGNGDSSAADELSGEETAADAAVVSVQAEAASYTAYTYSHTYTTLNDVTLSPSSETVSSVQTALIAFLTSNEGSYNSVNADDNGALSLGIFQWHGNNALTLMRLIVAEDNAAAYSALGSTLYEEIISSSTSWSERTLTSSEAAIFADCLSTTAGISIQDKMAASYTATYINAATSLGICNASAILIYGDTRNQRGSAGAKTTAAAAAALAGSYSTVTGNEMLIAAVACYPSTSSYYLSFVKRRLKCYQYAVDSGWTYCLSGDRLIPTSQSAAESTAVPWVQYTLNLVNGAGLTVNGTYDSATVSAVTAFQTASGLTADGEVGYTTIAALIEALYTYITESGTTTAALFGSSSSTSSSSASSASSAASSTSSSSSSSSSTSSKASTLKIANYNYPTTIKKGSSFSIKGTVKSNYKITKITIKVINSSGKTVLSATAKPGSKSYSLRKLDAKIKFSKLAAGKYTYKITATDTKKSKTLVKKTFKVRSLKISSIKYPTSIKKGKSFSIKGTIKSSYTITKVTVQVLDSDGNVVLSATAKPNKKTYKLQTKLDAKIKFGKLKKGTYTYKVIASDKKTSNITLVKKKFKVK